MPKDDFENQIIPISIKAKANEEIVFTALSKNLASDIKVFVEDRITNNFYEINNTDLSYKVIPTEDLNGEGRFYLHVSRQSLNINESIFDNVKIFNNNKDLHINGLNEGLLKIQLFDIAGKQVVVSKQNGNGSNTFNLGNINTGVYLVKVSFLNGTITKKIIIK